jgi:large subunit ribosomal protein L21
MGAILPAGLGTGTAGPGPRNSRLGDGPEHYSLSEQEESYPVYAIVRAGGRQEKVSVDDVLNIDKVSDETGATITWQPILVVDDGNVISDADKLSGYSVTAEILGETKGPKINILKYKNKTGYKKRQGHRQKHTQVRVTGIAAK